jgi:hypothetical protein
VGGGVGAGVGASVGVEPVATDTDTVSSRPEAKSAQYSTSPIFTFAPCQPSPYESLQLNV